MGLGHHRIHHGAVAEFQPITVNSLPKVQELFGHAKIGIVFEGGGDETAIVKPERKSAPGKFHRLF